MLDLLLSKNNQDVMFKIDFIYLFFKKKFIFALFYFTILYWFCHTLTRIHHECTCVPKHEPPSHLPPHNISQGHPRAPAPSILYPASNIDRRFVSYMIVYMFRCHSPKSNSLIFKVCIQQNGFLPIFNKIKSSVKEIW